MSAVVSSQSYILKLEDRSEVAERTLEFQLERPKGLTFSAGQFMDITLIDPPETDAEGDTRTFSISSGPDDPDLRFVTRVRDTAYKRVLKSARIGTEVRVDGPFGNLILHGDSSRPAVLLAGGIGITPFRSIVRRVVYEKLPHQLFLFYANRRPEDAPFLDEFRAFARENPNFTFVPTMTQLTGSRRVWKGEIGHIKHWMITKHLNSGTRRRNGPGGPIYYIAGPPLMVMGLRTMLKTARVDDYDIRTEDFSGY